MMLNSAVSTKQLLIVMMWCLQCFTSVVFASAVSAESYSSFWLWAGVAPQPVLQQAKTVYILQGQIDSPSHGVQTKLIPQGLAVPSAHKNEIWLTYRVHSLEWTPDIYRQIVDRWHNWQKQQGPMIGIQIDFDAKTHQLPKYADFLRKLKRYLPSNCQLSITGLLDWGNQNANELNKLGEIVDEIVIQTYQGRQTIANVDAYLPQFKRLKLPFKIGLAQRAQWTEPKDLAANPWFRGYVVFLTNP